MKRTEYLTLEEAVAIHDDLIARFGGAQGILDRGILESALARARSGYYPTLSAQAAALLHSLTLNHAFIDGNKRTAFVSMVIFLKLNGARPRFPTASTERFIIEQIVTKRVQLDEIITWIERHLAP